jgi:hypothetical protein
VSKENQESTTTATTNTKFSREGFWAYLTAMRLRGARTSSSPPAILRILSLVAFPPALYVQAGVSEDARHDIAHTTTTT